MKKNILTSLLLLLSIVATAQNKKQTITITTKLGDVHTYVVGETIDSTRVIEGVGIKVYLKGKKESEDYLLQLPIHQVRTPTATRIMTYARTLRDGVWSSHGSIKEQIKPTRSPIIPQREHWGNWLTTL